MENLNQNEINNSPKYNELYKKMINITDIFQSWEISNEQKEIIIKDIRNAYVVNPKLLYPLFSSNNVNNILTFCFENDIPECIVTLTTLKSKFRQVSTEFNSKKITPKEIEENINKYKDMIFDGGSYTYMIWNQIPDSEKSKYIKYYLPFSDKLFKWSNWYYDFDSNPKNYTPPKDINSLK